MNGSKLVIFDLEELYANHLMDYISDKKGMPFQTVVFTRKLEMLEYLANNSVDILLIEATQMCEEITKFDIGKIILLSDGSILSEYIGYDSIFKFKSAENIVREVLDYFVDLRKDYSPLSTSSAKAEVIGVYSPVGRCGKTSYALALGQVLAEEYKSLYINLEDYASFEELTDINCPSDLSDLMYYFKQNPEMIAIKLQAIVRTVNNLDYVAPIFYAKDLRDIETPEWIKLIDSIARAESYEKIIVDIGTMLGDIESMLEYCDTVFLPTTKDYLSVRKVETFKTILDRGGKKQLLDKLIEVQLPSVDEMNEFSAEVLEVSKLGEFAKEQIRKVERSRIEH